MNKEEFCDAIKQIDIYDKEEYKIRLLGSILVLTGTLCFLYFQVKTKNEVDSVSNI